jgi:HSP20 family protein
MSDMVKKESVPARRWSDPFQAFRSEMDHLFASFFGDRGLVAPRLGGMPSPFNGDAIVVPSVDLAETDKEMTLTVELPGMEEKDVDLSVRNGMLTLKGEKKYEHEDEKEDLYMVERRYGSFQRSFRLPDTVDAEKIDAKFDKGVLRVVMPKKAEAVAPVKKIAIRAH